MFKVNLRSLCVLFNQDNDSYNVIRNHIMKKTKSAAMSESELIEKLSKDWLERDGESFLSLIHI